MEREYRQNENPLYAPMYEQLRARHDVLLTAEQIARGDARPDQILTGNREILVPIGNGQSFWMSLRRFRNQLGIDAQIAERLHRYGLKGLEQYMNRMRNNAVEGDASAVSGLNSILGAALVLFPQQRR